MMIQESVQQSFGPGSSEGGRVFNGGGCGGCGGCYSDGGIGNNAEIKFLLYQILFHVTSAPALAPAPAPAPPAAP